MFEGSLSTAKRKQDRRRLQDRRVQCVNGTVIHVYARLRHCISNNVRIGCVNTVGPGVP